MTGAPDSDFVQHSLRSADDDGSGFPRTYVASWSQVGLQRFPGPFGTCHSVLPETAASFRLHVTSKDYGRLSITMNTFDRLGNYPGVNATVLEGDVALMPGNGIRINQVGGLAWCNFYGASLVSPTMEAEFSAPWAARREGELCFSGTNHFPRRRFALTQVGRTPDGQFEFGA